MTVRLATVLIFVLAESACGRSSKYQAFASATQYAQNAVGDKGAPVWDTLTCYYDVGLKTPWHVSGYVNGRGKGAQLFVVNFGTDGKASGDVELKPIKDPDPSEVGYWLEIERLRQADSDKQCSDWMTFAGTASSTYWHAIQDGFGPGVAMQKMMEARNQLLQVTKR